MGDSVTPSAKDAYALYKKVKKAREYYRSTRNLLDEDSRSGEMFKLGLKGLLAVGEKIVGAPLSKHPYFTYHKAHIELLVQTLDATSTYDHAMQALQAAIKSADASEALVRTLGSLTSRQKVSKLNYGLFVAGGLGLQRDQGTSPDKAAAQMKQAGLTPQVLDSLNQQAVYAWQAQVCETFFDGAKLLVMVDLEYRAAQEAMNRYNSKVKKLQEGKSNIGRIAGYAAERDRQLQQIERELDRINSPSSSGASPQAVEDPASFALRQRDKVDAVVQVLADNCDVAMSEDAWYPDRINVRYR